MQLNSLDSVSQRKRNSSSTWRPTSRRGCSSTRGGLLPPLLKIKRMAWPHSCRGLSRRGKHKFQDPRVAPKIWGRNRYLRETTRKPKRYLSETKGQNKLQSIILETTALILKTKISANPNTGTNTSSYFQATATRKKTTKNSWISLKNYTSSSQAHTRKKPQNKTPHPPPKNPRPPQ